MLNNPSQFGEQWYLMGVTGDIECQVPVQRRKITSIAAHMGWILDTVNTLNS